MKNEICNRCPHEDTEKCETCEKRVCRVCGCTWSNACPGGCYWVEFDLCSECVGKEPTQTELTYIPSCFRKISLMLKSCIISWMRLWRWTSALT